jgi:flagellar FliL protein
MAEKKVEAAAEAALPKKKGKLMLFIIIGVVVLLLIVGGAAFMLMKSSAPADGEEGDEETTSKVDKKKKDKKKDAHAAPAFYKFDKPFTVKLQSEAGEAYLQVEIQAKVRDPMLVEQLKAYDPEIKHKVTLLLLGKKSTELNNPQGVQQLSNEIRETINQIVEPASGKKKAAAPVGDEGDPDAPVQMILFTTFIIQ